MTVGNKSFSYPIVPVLAVPLAKATVQRKASGPAVGTEG